MSEGGFFALRVAPGEPGIVNVPDDLTLTISHVAAAPDAGTTRLSLVTTDYTGATAAAHLLTLQPKKQDHALVDLSFPPGEAVTFAADGGAVDLCGAMQCVDEGPMGATYDDDDDDDDAEYRAYMDELDVARRYLDAPSDSDDDDSDAFADEFVDFSDDDDAFDGDEELERAVRKRSIDIDDDAEGPGKRRAADGSDDESSEDEPAPPPAKKKKTAAKKKKLAAKKGR